MTFLPVPKQIFLFTAACPSRLLSYTLLPFTFLSPLLPVPDPPPLWLVTPPSRAQQPVGDAGVHGWCMASAWLVHA